MEQRPKGWERWLSRILYWISGPPHSLRDAFGQLMIVGIAWCVFFLAERLSLEAFVSPLTNLTVAAVITALGLHLLLRSIGMPQSAALLIGGSAILTVVIRPYALHFGMDEKSSMSLMLATFYVTHIFGLRIFEALYPVKK